VNATLFRQINSSAKDTLVAIARVALPGRHAFTKAEAAHAISAELEFGNGAVKAALRNNGFQVD
jgi:UDP-N-acetylmuramate-alanine ligase